MPIRNRSVVKDQNLNFSCTKRQKALWEEVANMMGMSLGAYARKCIEMTTSAYLRSKNLEIDVKSGKIVNRK